MARISILNSVRVHGSYSRVWSLLLRHGPPGVWMECLRCLWRPLYSGWAGVWPWSLSWAHHCCSIPFANFLQKLLGPALLPLWLANSRHLCDLEQVALPPWLQWNCSCAWSENAPGQKARLVPGLCSGISLLWRLPVPETAASYFLSSLTVEGESSADCSLMVGSRSLTVCL